VEIYGGQAFGHGYGFRRNIRNPIKGTETGNKTAADSSLGQQFMKKFVKLAAGVVVLVLNGARNGADAYGPGLIDSLVQQYQQVEHASSVHATGDTNGAAVTDKTTRVRLSMRKNKPLLEVLSLQQAEQSKHKHSHAHKKGSETKHKTKHHGKYPSPKPLLHSAHAKDTAKASCVPKYAASSLHMSLTGSVTPVWLYKNSHQEALNLPDFHPVAYRTADGQCHLTITHYENYRISGASLESLTSTQKTFDSNKVHSAAWGDFGHHQWVASPFTEDGRVFYALAHSEWYACLQYGNDPVKGCSVGNNQLNSWVNAITMFRSDDGGASWSPSGGNGVSHVVLAPSMQYPANWGFWAKSFQMHNYGFFHPSNIIQEGSYYYAVVLYIHRTAAGGVDAAGAILVRTSSLASTRGWTVWDGTAYTPITGSWDQKLPVFADIPIVEAQMTTISWSASVCQYIILFGSSGLKFATTASLASPQLSALRTVAGGDAYNSANYPILQDDTHPGYNFDTLGSDSAYLYTVRQNGGLDRDVVKQRVTLSGSGPSPGPGPTPGPTPGPSSVHVIYRCALPTGHLTSIHSDCEGIPGAKQEGVLGYLSNGRTSSTHALYRCSSGGDHFISNDAGCEGSTVDGILGWIWNAPRSGLVALYRCLMTDKHHMTSLSSTCEGGGSREGIMGYVLHG
jgi:hypothetical protein